MVSEFEIKIDTFECSGYTSYGEFRYLVDNKDIFEREDPTVWDYIIHTCRQWLGCIKDILDTGTATHYFAENGSFEIDMEMNQSKNVVLRPKTKKNQAEPSEFKLSNVVTEGIKLVDLNIKLTIEKSGYAVLRVSPGLFGLLQQRNDILRDPNCPPTELSVREITHYL